MAWIAMKCSLTVISIAEFEAVQRNNSGFSKPVYGDTHRRSTIKRKGAHFVQGNNNLAVVVLELVLDRLRPSCVLNGLIKLTSRGCSLCEQCGGKLSARARRCSLGLGRPIRGSG